MATTQTKFGEVFINKVTLPIYEGLGLANPYLRALFLVFTLGLPLYMFKPNAMFDGGNMRPWIVTSPEAPERTVFPFFGALLLFAVIGVLI